MLFVFWFFCCCVISLNLLSLSPDRYPLRPSLMKYRSYYISKSRAFSLLFEEHLPAWSLPLAISGHTGPCVPEIMGHITAPSCLWPPSRSFHCFDNPLCHSNSQSVIYETREVASSSMFGLLDWKNESVLYSNLLSNPRVGLPVTYGDAEYNSLQVTLGHCKSLCSDGVECPYLSSISQHQQNIFIKQLSTSERRL